MKIPQELSLVWSKIENKKIVYWGTAAAIVASVIAAFVPYIYGRLVDVAIKANTSAGVKTIIFLIVLWLVLSLARDFIDRYSGKAAFRISNELFCRFHIDIVYHLLRLPLKFHKDRKTGKVSYEIIRGVEELDRLIESTIFSFLPAVLSLIISVIILLFVEWRLAVVLLISSVAYVLVTLLYTQRIIKNQEINHKKWSKAYNERYEAIMNVETIKATSNEPAELKRLTKNFMNAGNYYTKFRNIWFQMDAWQSFIFTLSFIIVFSGGVFMLRSGALSPGKLIMFVGYIGLFTSPLSRLTNTYRNTRNAIVSFKKSIKYLDIDAEKDFTGAKELKEIKGSVYFENVSFGYKKDKLILKSISFKVGAGETVALVGESGVGKTTIVNLVGRYFLPETGKILIDNIDIKKIKLNFLRDNMALVPQEVMLFNDTVKNNIQYGKLGATDKEVIEAAKAANAHEFIESFPKKYEQLVGERGIKLSTGQKQRIAIARAILRDPKILILDEATSALDSVSEKLVQEALARLIKGRTTFIIAHRLSTIQHADKIIVLEKGKVAETGTHQELMRDSQGIYRNFWELQTAIQKVR